MRARVVVAVALLALAGAPPTHAAGGGAKPNGRELWHAYPLKPQASAAPAGPTATATRTPNRPAATRSAGVPAKRASDSGGGSAVLLIALAILVAAALAATAATLRRRSAKAPADPAPARPHLWTTAARPEEQPTPERPRRDARTGERLRAAVDIQRGREWPWPEGSEGLWRCEIGPDPAALSARFRAVLHPPDGDPPRVLAVSSASSAGGDWQSSAPIAHAVNALAAQLEAEGWEPVAGGGDPHTRRFCWRRDGAPHARLQETAWSA